MPDRRYDGFHHNGEGPMGTIYWVNFWLEEYQHTPYWCYVTGCKCLWEGVKMDDENPANWVGKGMHPIDALMGRWLENEKNNEKNKEITVKEEKRRKPGWNVYFMSIAEVVATRSNCIRRQVGAVIVREGRIISTGYNGTPRGLLNCDEGGCARCANSTGFVPSGTALGECLCCHAEENALVQSAYHGISVKGGTIYTLLTPCLFCTKMIINAGIERVYYKEVYPNDEVWKMLTAANIHIEKV